jgi:hypothetical protein
LGCNAAFWSVQKNDLGMLDAYTSAMTPRSYPKRIDPMEANTPTRNW